MLHAAKPDPVISAHVHHYAKSLRWGGKHAIHELLTEHEPGRLPPWECGAGRKIGPFSFRLSLPVPYPHLVRHAPPSCLSRCGIERRCSIMPYRASQQIFLPTLRFSEDLVAFSTIFGYMRRKSDKETQNGTDAKPQLPQPFNSSSH